MKTRRDDQKGWKPGGRKFGMKINFIHFQLYESYEIKFPSKNSSLTVVSVFHHTPYNYILTKLKLSVLTSCNNAGLSTCQTYRSHMIFRSVEECLSFFSLRIRLFRFGQWCSVEKQMKIRKKSAGKLRLPEAQQRDIQPSYSYLAYT